MRFLRPHRQYVILLRRKNVEPPRLLIAMCRPCVFFAEQAGPLFVWSRLRTGYCCIIRWTHCNTFVTFRRHVSVEVRVIYLCWWVVDI